MVCSVQTSSSAWIASLPPQKEIPITTLSHMNESVSEEGFVIHHIIVLFIITITPMAKAKAEAATTTKISIPPVIDDIAMTKDDVMDDDDDAAIVVTSILESNTSAKSVGGFRSYGDDDDDDDDDDVRDGAFGGCGGTPKRVLMHYRDMRTYQTVEFHDRMATKYSFEDGKYRCVVFRVV